MSYNTRGRVNDSSHVGQRRNQSLSNNFISGGQLASNPQHQQQQKRYPQQQQQQQYQRPNMFVVTNGNYQGQQQQQQQHQQGSQLVQKPPAALQPVQQQPQPQKQQQQPPPPAPPSPLLPPPPPPLIHPSTEQQQPRLQEPKSEQHESMETTCDDTETTPKKQPFRIKNKSGKISKKEKMRRRNAQLSRILQPKNAIVILNELKSVEYNVSDLPILEMNDQYMAKVVVDDVEHVGYGKNKTEAKNNAAESALKHIVKSRQLTPIRTVKDSNDKNSMDFNEDASSLLPWQHVASYALFKLLHSWGEDPVNATKNIMAQTAVDSAEMNATVCASNGNKPSKKLPENAAEMNPLMLINQMLPFAKFEERQRTGIPPNIIFTIACSVNDEEFIGNGKNKKAAKKHAAFQVCQKILGVQYPPEAMEQ